MSYRDDMQLINPVIALVAGQVAVGAVLIVALIALLQVTEVLAQIMLMGV
jgi:hypothetical protein